MKDWLLENVCGRDCQSVWQLCVSRILPIILLFLFSVALHAQTITGTTSDGLVYSASNGQVSIVGWCGGNSNLTISGTIDVSGTNLPVTSIENKAFYNCLNLWSVTIPPSVVSIGDYAFYNCSRLWSVTIPPSVVSIGNYAFENCQILSSVTIPNGVISIGSGAFAGSALYYANIPSSVTNIGVAAFSVNSLLSITVDPDNPAYCSVGGVLFDSSQTTLVQYPIGNYLVASYTIPSSVISIGKNAFSRCLYLTNITIPSSVNSIDQAAFAQCSRLKTVNMSFGLQSIGISAFGSCSSLTSITIPTSVTSIDSYAFSATGLTSIYIPASVNSIGDSFGTSPFYLCNSLADITVDPQSSFFCSNEGVLFDRNKIVLIQYPPKKPATYYKIPSSVTAIQAVAFSRCSNLTSITIPSGVTNIGGEAFVSCPNLGAVIFLGSAPTVNYQIFLSHSVNFCVYFFEGAVGFTAPTWTDSSGATWPSVCLGTGPTSIQSWQFVYFGLSATNSLISGDTVANNQTGIDNLIAYATGADPYTVTVATLPASGLTTVSGTNYLTLSFSHNPCATDLSYIVEGSIDLTGSWSAISTFSSGSWNPASYVTETSGTAIIQDSTPLGSVPQRFMRLRVVH